MHTHTHAHMYIAENLTDTHTQARATRAMTYLRTMAARMRIANAPPTHPATMAVFPLDLDDAAGGVAVDIGPTVVITVVVQPDPEPEPPPDPQPDPIGVAGVVTPEPAPVKARA